jgi:hypothetical protein
MTPESTSDAAAKAAHRPRVAYLRTYLGPLLAVVVCLVLFPAFTVIYVTVEQNQNNHKFCATVNAVVAPPPPPGNAKQNPSRAYDQDLHAAFMGLKARLGC